MLRRFLLWILVFSVCIPAAFADLKEGRDYRRLSVPQATQSGGKVEVLEFFYYGCPHCYDLQSPLQGWVKRMPKDVEFKSVPAVFRDSWIPLAKTYYALEALGILPKLHDQVFDAIHVGNIDLSVEKTLFDWMAKHGVDRQKFMDAYHSFSVQSKVAKTVQMTKSYEITGTPTLVVDGKYLTSASFTGSPQATVATLEELVKLARKERTQKN